MAKKEVKEEKIMTVNKPKEEEKNPYVVGTYKHAMWSATKK